MAVPPATPGWVASGSPPPVGGPGAERTGGVGRGREAERGPAQAAAAGSALRSRRRLQEEARWLRRRGGGEAEAAREDAPRLRRERYGAASRTRAQAAAERRRRGAPDGGRRRAVGRGVCPGWPRPRGPGRIPRTPRAAAQTKPARHSGGSEGVRCGGEGTQFVAAVAGLLPVSLGQLEEWGAALPRAAPGLAGCPGARRLPGLAGARLTNGRARWSSGFAGNGCGGRPPAWRWRGCGAGERCADLWVLYQEQTAQWLALGEPCPQVVGGTYCSGRQGPAWCSLDRAWGKQQVLSGGHPGWG